MASAGLYELSGDWLYQIGVPGKSGVSGGIVTVSPGKGGLATYSPPLDAAGNSIRGQLATKYLAERLGLGDKQAKAKLCRVEIEEVAVAFGPPTGCEVITEAAHCPLLGVRPDAGPDRYSATDMFVQVCLGPAPVGLEEAVSAVPRNGHRLDPGSDRAGQLGSEGRPQRSATSGR